MALLNVIQHSFYNNEIMHRTEMNDIRTYSSLIVTEGQVAVFLKNGAIVSSFEAGRHTLKTDVIPIWNTFVSKFYGGDSPYNAEVIFIKTTNILNVNWGTTTPIQARDKEFRIPIKMVGYGKFGFRITNYLDYIRNFVGDAKQQTTLNVYNSLSTNIYEIFTNELVTILAKNSLSGLDVSLLTKEISDNVKKGIPDLFSSNGLTFINFAVESLTLTDDVMELLTEVQAKKLEVDTLGDKYEMVKKFEVMTNFSLKENAEGGGGNNDIANLMVTANVMKDFFNNTNSTPNNENVVETNINTATFYFLLDDNGNRSKPLTFNKVKTMIESKEINKDNLVFYNGIEDYIELSISDKFKEFFN